MLRSDKKIPMSILVIDDDPEIRSSVGMFLQARLERINTESRQRFGLAAIVGEGGGRILGGGVFGGKDVPWSGQTGGRLPRELSEPGQRVLSSRFARRLTEGERLPYTLAIHRGGPVR